MFQHIQKGFTLGGLLVAVLIIAILAAVALPQYKKAVFKARLMQHLPLAQRLADEAGAFYTANGYFPTADELGIEETENSRYNVYCINGNGKQEAEPSDCGIVIVTGRDPYVGDIVGLWLVPFPELVFEEGSPFRQYHRFCMANQYPEVASFTHAVCRSFGGERLSEMMYGW